MAEEFTKYLDAIECIVSFPSGTFVQIWVGISPSPQLHFGQLAYGPTVSYSRAQKFGNKFCGMVLNKFLIWFTHWIRLGKANEFMGKTR